MLKLLLGFVISIGVSAMSLNQLRQLKVIDYRNLMAPPANIKYFTLGFNNAVADSLWIRLIQDMDYCGGVNLTEHDWQQNKEQKPVCSNGWVAKMFHHIVDLSPDFYLVYRVGVTALAVIVGDLDGAESFIERATRRYPNDWTIAYRAAYFYIYERKNLARAAELLRIAGLNGAPEWVLSLSSRLFSEAGQLELGISVLEETIKTTKEENFRKNMEVKLQNLREKYQKLKK